MQYYVLVYTKVNGVLVILCQYYKSGEQFEQQNYRGITIMNTFCKIFACVLNNRIHHFITENKILNNEQIGFQKNCRTSGHIFVLRTLIESAKQLRKPLGVCFIDYQKAFDTVWKPGLYFKLSKVMIFNPNIRLFLRLLLKIRPLDCTSKSMLIKLKL